jgi:hypothetical protein
MQTSMDRMANLVAQSVITSTSRSADCIAKLQINHSEIQEELTPLIVSVKSTGAYFQTYHTLTQQRFDVQAAELASNKAAVESLAEMFQMRADDDNILRAKVDSLQQVVSKHQDDIKILCDRNVQDQIDRDEREAV